MMGSNPLASFQCVQAPHIRWLRFNQCMNASRASCGVGASSGVSPLEAWCLKAFPFPPLLLLLVVVVVVLVEV